MEASLGKEVLDEFVEEVASFDEFLNARIARSEDRRASKLVNELDPSADHTPSAGHSRATLGASKHWLIP
jgi:hypothetical protein